jgi:hypothetical protein
MLESQADSQTKSAADGTGGTISRTISYIAHIRSAQSHNDNPIARATWLLL